MPCRHMCVVINDPIYYTADLFNIRWYIAYNYYYNQDYAKDKVPKVFESLNKLHDISVKSSWNFINGEF